VDVVKEEHLKTPHNLHGKQFSLMPFSLSKRQKWKRCINMLFIVEFIIMTIIIKIDIMDSVVKNDTT
jgi:hypothetical protein